MSIRNNYNHTIVSSTIGYVTQAIVNNFTPLLFIMFQKKFHFSLEQITLLVTINFGIQLIVAFLSVKFADKLGYRLCIVSAHIFAAIGLVGVGIFPDWFSNPYTGLVVAVCLYAVGGGIIEVLVSPIVEACPTKRKSAMMSLLHSFYCWGYMAVILLSTLFFSLWDIRHYPVLALLWAMVPAFNAIYFSLVPINRTVDVEEGLQVKELISIRLFWVFVLLMVCSGASEQAISQWASAFAEVGLKISKTAGDLAGPFMFAFFMGSSRLLYSRYSEKIDLYVVMLGSGLLCIFGYLLTSLSFFPILSLIGCAITGFSVGILWPGTISMSSRACPKGGTPMFAILALAGDLGCSIGPTVVGATSKMFQENFRIGILFAMVFPVLLIILLLSLRVGNKK